MSRDERNAAVMTHYVCRCGESIEDGRIPNPKVFHTIRDDDIERVQCEVIEWIRGATNRGDHLREDDFEADLLTAIMRIRRSRYRRTPRSQPQGLFLICHSCDRLRLVNVGDGRWDQITWQLEEGNPCAVIERAPPGATEHP